MAQHRNVILIGMPGSGKSTLGILLAKALVFDFIDTDVVIQTRQHGRLIEILERLGAEQFCAVENQYCAELELDQYVVATGGSVIYSSDAMTNFQRLGTIVYLSIEFDELLPRITDMDSRGIVMQPGQSFADLYAERVPLYRQFANITVDCTGEDHEHTVSQIMAALNADN